MTGHELHWTRIDCPYCGESFETAVDASAGAQRYTEDCAVCCRPIVFEVGVDDEATVVRTRREQD